MTDLLTVDNIMALLTLTILEIVLGIDNIIFISLLVDKLPKERQKSARTLGLFLALLVRLGLLSVVSWLAKLDTPLFEIRDFEPSVRDLILIVGGIFLLYKSTVEIHAKVVGHEEHAHSGKKVSFSSIITQIILIDIVFSFDSILTAIGLSGKLLIMVIAVVISMVVMILFAGKVAEFISKRPTVKMLALSFLLLIGVMLVMEGFGQHINKNYIYFALAFSLGVEMLNLRAKRSKVILDLEDEASSTKK